jgi:O-acetyl-ADP-ribose deacetylase (regulator of RNase III)
MEECDMIREQHGNLLRSDADALVNTVNTVGVMGKGIALQFRRTYPAMFNAYESAAKNGDIRIGEMFVWETGALSGPRFIINFPTKRHWRAPSRIEDIESGLVDLVAVIKKYDIMSIAIPPLGCGNGGLPWDDVAPRILQALRPLADAVDIHIYPPQGAPAAADMVNRTKEPRMTAARAAIVKLLQTYQSISAHGTTLVEAQKLAYFLQQAGEDLRLDFVKGRYGPYADNLRKTLSQIEGHFITGFGDGSAKTLDAEPLFVIPEAGAAADAVLTRTDTTTRRVARVIALTEGFDSMYGMELLATVHWVAAHDPSPQHETIAAAVQSWNDRKGRLFTNQHVAEALARLHDQEWLPVDTSS